MWPNANRNTKRKASIPNKREPIGSVAASVVTYALLWDTIYISIFTCCDVYLTRTARKRPSSSLGFVLALGTLAAKASEENERTKI